MSLVEKVLEVFKAGVYPQGPFGQKELAQITETYDAKKLHEAPLTIGHTSDYKDTKAPAFGWVKKVINVGGALKVVADFTEELAHLIKAGHYKKVSVGLYEPNDPTNPTPGKWHLHHVAFLGAAPPAVKGLEAVAFSTLPVSVVEMQEVDAVTSEMNVADTYETIQECFATALSKVEDALKENIDDDTKRQRIELALSDCYAEIHGALALHYAFEEKAESIMEKLKSKAAEMVERLFSSHNTKESDMDETAKKDLEAREKAIAEQQAALDRQKAEFAQQQKAVEDEAKAREAAERKARHEAAITAFREECKAKKLPVNKMEEAGVFKTAALLLDAGQVEFSADNKKPAFEVFKSLVTAFQPVETERTESVEFSASDDAMVSAAKSLDIKPGQLVPAAGMEKVAFAQAYVRKHSAEIPGDTEREKVSVVLTKMGLGEIKLDPKSLE